MADEADIIVEYNRDRCIDYRLQCEDLQSPTKCWMMRPCRGLCPLLFHHYNPLDNRYPFPRVQ